LSID